MLSIESRLYQILLLLVQLMVLNVLVYLLSIPLFPIPVTVFYLCHCVLNIIEGKKMFFDMKLTRRIWQQFMIAAVIGLFSAYTIYALMMNRVSFPTLFIAAFLISFNIISYMLILRHEGKIMDLLKTAFFYSIVYFYKTVVVIFIFLFISIEVFKVFPVAFAIGAIALFFYLFIKWNDMSLLTSRKN